jgi:hypothetical protein
MYKNRPKKSTKFTKEQDAIALLTGMENLKNDQNSNKFNEDDVRK